MSFAKITSINNINDNIVDFKHAHPRISCFNACTSVPMFSSFFYIYIYIINIFCNLYAIIWMLFPGKFTAYLIMFMFEIEIKNF